MTTDIKLNQLVINKLTKAQYKEAKEAGNIVDTEIYMTIDETSNESDDNSVSSTHASDTSNPHEVTKAQVGLGNVDNTSDMNKPVSTAQATAIADAKKAGTDAQSNLTTHINNTSNPHGVTASQVGAVPTSRTVNGKALSSNITLSASDVSAVPTSRTVNGKALSSNITLSASDIGADASGSASTVQGNLDSHTGDTSNPHGVTKSQVGLGNVPNVATNDQTPTYTQATTLANLTSGEKLSVSFGKIMKAIADLISHIGNTSNPHSVTKSQVGLGNVDNTADSTKSVKYATTAGSLTNLTATVAELNYVDGVTSNIQTQLDGKAPDGNYAGSSSAGGSANSAVKLDTTTAGSGTQPVYFSGGKPVATTYSLAKSVPSDAKFTDTTYDIATTTANGLMSATDKAKLDATNVAYATCDTAAATAAKVVTVSGNDNWNLVVGSIIMVKFSISNEASNVTLNVNNTGAYPIWYNNAEYTSTGTAYTGYANRTTTYMFNGTHWVWVSNSYDSNTQSNTNSTNTSNKIFLVGATSQGSNKTTYSHDTVYVGTDGHVYSDSKQVVNVSGTQTLTNKSLTSPALTGTPTAPTAATGTNTTQIATTAFVTNAIENMDSGDVFIATFGTTSFDDIKAAYELGKEVKVQRGTEIWEFLSIYNGQSLIFTNHAVSIKEDSDFRVDYITQNDGLMVCDMFEGWYIKGLSGRVSYTPSTHASSHAIGGSDPITPESIGAAAKEDLVEIKSSNLIFSNKVVSVGDWVSDTTYAAYPYKATISCSEVDSSYFPDVCYDLTDALSGNFAPVCESITNGIYIYCIEIPSSDITIPSIRCTKMAE